MEQFILELTLEIWGAVWSADGDDGCAEGDAIAAIKDTIFIDGKALLVSK